MYVSQLKIFGYRISQAWPSLNRLNSERCMNGFALVSSFTFQRTYAQFDLAALVSVLDIDQTMTDELALLDKSMYPSVASREQLLVNILRKTFFIQMGR
jgi:hypothetical protein